MSKTRTHVLKPLRTTDLRGRTQMQMPDRNRTESMPPRISSRRQSTSPTIQSRTLIANLQMTKVQGGPEPGTEKQELLPAPDGNKSIPAIDFECDSTSQRRTFVYVSCSICSFSTASVREASFLECATSCVSSSCSRPIESPVLSRRIRLCAVHVLASPQSRLPG